MNKSGNTFVTVVIIGIIVAFTVFLVKYGSTPVSELPAWAFWLLNG